MKTLSNFKSLTNLPSTTFDDSKIFRHPNYNKSHQKIRRLNSP